MSFAATFDTHKFVRKLKGAGFNEAQAEALTDAVRESQASADIATRGDLQRLEERFDAKLEKLELRLTGEMKLLKWGMGIVITGIASLILKAFF